MRGPERFAAPAADAVTFRPGFRRTFAGVLAIALPLYAASLILAMLARGPAFLPGWVVAEMIAQFLGGSVVYAAVFGLLRWSWCRDWLRVSSAGLELASRGSAPLLVPWAAVESVRAVRRFGTPTLQVVTRGGGRPHLVDIWLMRPGRAALRSALDARLEAHQTLGMSRARPAAKSR